MWGLKEGGLTTPKGGTRTPTGCSPEPKKSRLSPDEEDGGETQGRGRRPPNAPGAPSYSGVPVPPPPGTPHPANPQGVVEQPPSNMPVLTLQDIVTQMQQDFKTVGDQVQQLRGDINRDIGQLRKDQQRVRALEKAGGGGNND